jgi:hypothetical protein
MLYLGIDFSINSTAVSVFNSHNQKWNFFNFRNKKDIKGDCNINYPTINDLFSIDTNNIWIIPVEYLKYLDEKDLTNKELIDTKNSIILSNQIYKTLGLDQKKTISLTKNITIEGFSYSSTGKDTNKMIGFNYTFRNLIINDYNITFCSPKGVKKFAGNGNWDKQKMIEAFMIEKDETITHIRKIMIDKWVRINRNNRVVYDKPIDDLVDSYYLNKWGYANYRQ